ncbi:unnamed protein product [Rhizophagus irregularis]|uniref:protein-tyrosine-phosphatase n=2 Tax=Rhizophagus irregularis TaxID=588596 RepID=A0A2I1DVQ7_9GLOM|nr:protein-tyrosine phosphatase-like protein [Rhizophagus irregularis DAOM 181602=DAOM 197198]PKY13962.1 DSPc-domain-containing protein [Rhizophagus irregularis]POG71952.1 protein-tyrosine phosphatase-like protein [Rhizophagus irregularis DAOM 181602=DAOM 197198]CAB5379218.1 unnamed protein product [Rhizophagus irregularis]|eukprot:XP_025178818.1 protein-tyrosine phosphatase-like protein [Rhizophagus irregularis DAOM 181602=DAOM 197198]
MPDLATKTITTENVKKEVANNIYFGPIYPNQVIGGLTVPRFRTSINEKSLSRIALASAHKARKPSVILKDFLYLSGAKVGANGDLLAKNKITHIINISPCRNFFESKIPISLLQKYPNWKSPKYLRLYVKDRPEENIEKFFNVSNKFIYDAKRDGGRVLVHCWAGVSRSASLILAYLMNQYGCTYNRALNYVKKKRSIVEPNCGFCLQLSKYELELMRTLGIPIDGISGTKRKYDEVEFVDIINVNVGSVVEEGERNVFDWGTKGIFDPSTYRYNKMRKLI